MIDVAELRARFPLSGGDAEERYAVLLAQAIALWEDKTARPWVRQVGRVERFSPRHERVESVWLGLAPVEAVTLVEEKASGATSWTTVDVTGYELVGDHELRRVAAYWPRDVRVTYTGGYVASGSPGATTPADVRAAIITQAAFMAARLDQAKLVTSSVAVEGASTSYLAPTLHPLFAQVAMIRRRKT